VNEEQTDERRGDWLDKAMEQALASFRAAKPDRLPVKGKVIFAKARFKKRGAAL
jgi:hypothetical protein